MKARIWVFDEDESGNFDHVYDCFDMNPSEEWKTGTIFGDIKNYKFTFTASIMDKNKVDVVIKKL